ncbi:MAG: hypothetical protein EU539_02575 [Promethearchaeota archaeon]|nr:MAG: hypothetical protein EU539_02575 [Candidatus Lokiarchaeota archaeon]
MINFDAGISSERRMIIQFLANYIMYDSNNLMKVIFIYISWMVICLIPILNFNNYKQAYSMNLYTFFFPNFFFYVFLYRYSPNYFDLNLYVLGIKTFILGLLIITFSIGLSILLSKTVRKRGQSQLENFKKLIEKHEYKCPYCGTNMNSISVYCYNCLKKLELDNDEL